MRSLVSDFLTSLPPGPVIVEAGAHNGDDTLKLASGARHVHAFEPVLALREVLERAVRGCSNVTTYPLALGGANGTRPMWISTGAHNCDASSSLLEPTLHRTMFPQIPFQPEPVDVTVTTLRHWARTTGVTVHGAWLDMQGGELAALQGAGALLDDVQAIVIEFSVVELYDGCPLWPEVQQWLRARGFTVAVEEIDVGQPQGNALVIR